MNGPYRTPQQTINLDKSEKQKKEEALVPLVDANHADRRKDYFRRRRLSKPPGSGAPRDLEEFRAESKRYSDQKAAERANRRLRGSQRVSEPTRPGSPDVVLIDDMPREPD